MSYNVTDAQRNALLVANDAAALVEKVTPASADLVVIEDSADGFAKKKVQIGNIGGGGGGSAEPVRFPYTYDNSSGDLASLTVDDTQFGSEGGILLYDGANTKIIHVANLSSGQSADLYDTGGGLGWDAGAFSIVLGLAYAATDTTIQPVWEKVAYGTVGFSGYGIVVGDGLYLSNDTGRNDLISGEALKYVQCFAPNAADEFYIDGVTFTGVSGSADPAAQEFDVDAGSTTLISASLIAAVNDPASQALLTIATGATVTAYPYIGGTGSGVYFGAGGGYDLTINWTNFGFGGSSWTDQTTAVVITPGNNIA